MLLALLVAHHVDDHRRCQNQHVILPFGDVHTVSVGPGEPLLADFGHLPPLTFEGVLVVEKAALRFEIVRAGNIHGELAAKEREELLLHHRNEPAMDFNFVGRSPVE